MNESPGSPSPPTAPPRKINPWLIAALVVLLACCFCVGAIGLLLAFGEPILHELGLTGWLPALTIPV